MNRTIRGHFPFLTQSESGSPLIYFDNAATTQKPVQVIEALADFYRFDNANPQRGIYDLSERATNAYKAARDAVARYINAPRDGHLVFTSGATHAINLFALSWGVHNLKPGDEIVLTVAEHHSNMIPWHKVAAQTGARIRYLELEKETCALRYPCEGLINERTRLVAVAHRSNVIGAFWGKDDHLLSALIADAHRVGARLFLDAAQSVIYGLDVGAMGVDAAAFSGHKMFGPMGIGILYLTAEIEREMEPAFFGGGMLSYASQEGAVWHQAPEKYEAGTPPVGQAVGLHAAVEYLARYAPGATLHEHTKLLSRSLIEGLEQLPGIRIIADRSSQEACGGLVSFGIDRIHPHDIAHYLATRNIAVRAGNHCAQPLHTFLGINASLRVSFSLYNTQQEVAVFLDALYDACKALQGCFDD